MIKLVATDVDGVLTDCGMYYTESGDEFKKFNTRDGMGVEILKNQGVEVVIMTRENTQIVANRSKKLKIDRCFQGCRDKLTIMKNLLTEMSLQPDEVAYIGDDVNDLEVLELVGFSGCPADAVAEAIAVSDYHCKLGGGGGCFREFADQVLQKNRRKDDQ